MAAAHLLAACARDIPIPANREPATLRDWAARHFPDSQDWRFVTLSETGALYLDRDIGKGRYPLIRYRAKYENYAPALAANRRFRSTRVTYEADCGRMIHHIAEVTAYADSRLAGASFAAANPLPDWSAPPMGSEGYRLSALACTLAQPAAYDLDDPRVIKFENAAISTTQIAAEVWVRQQGLAADGWTLIGAGPASAEFVSDRAFDFAAYPLIRYDAKTEYYAAVDAGGRAALSEGRRVEADCDGQRRRDLSIGYFAGQNLAGEVVAEARPTPWTTAADGQTLPLSELTACMFAYELKYLRRLDPATAAGKDLF